MLMHAYKHAYIICMLILYHAYEMRIINVSNTHLLAAITLFEYLCNFKQILVLKHLYTNAT